ncbi:MAG: type 2 periplasmic-binding domain-containing protein [Planctomycetota bacterium]|jgi:hypothetical protein
MRFASLLFVTMLAACASMKAPYPAAQDIVDGVAAKHPELVRLTLHAVPEGKTECTQVASTAKKRRGKPSDPEDLEAMKTGRQVVLDEPGAIDVTVPILRKGNKPTAVAGVTLRAAEGADRAALVNEARAIAEELAVAVRAAGKPVW